MSLDSRSSRGTNFLRPPDDLPTDPDRFFRSGPPLTPEPHPHHPPHHHLPDAPPPSALDRLGSSPLPKTGFPFIGFLSSVYEHVSQVAKGEPPPTDT